MEEPSDTLDAPKSNEDFLKLFDKLKPSNPLFQPNGDTFYLFEPADEKKIKGNYKTMVKDGQDFVRND